MTVETRGSDLRAILECAYGRHRLDFARRVEFFILNPFGGFGRSVVSVTVTSGTTLNRLRGFGRDLVVRVKRRA
jgi:hypothetical protein